MFDVCGLKDFNIVVHIGIMHSDYFIQYKIQIKFYGSVR